MSKFVVGLDLGQAQDYTALAVLERLGEYQNPATQEYYGGRPAHLEDPRAARLGYGPQGFGQNNRSNDGPSGTKMLPQYHCRHLERFPLGTRYPAIVEAVAARMATAPLLDNCRLVVDATGCGRPVADQFKQAGLNPVAVTITGGHTPNYEGGMWRVPKLVLVSTLQALLQPERLKINAVAPESANLVSELLSFQVTKTEAANETYGGRQGTHDDLVLAVALAAWWAERNVQLPVQPQSFSMTY